MSLIARCFYCHITTRTLPFHGHRVCVVCIMGHKEAA